MMGTQNPQRRTISRPFGLLACAMLVVVLVPVSAWSQAVSGVRAFGGGVAPLFNLVGPGSLYIDNDGTQGHIYNFGNNFQSYNFRNPATGQAWSGGMMTLGPQLSIGLIQGANQVGSPLLLVPPPREPLPLPPVEATILDIP